MADTSSMIKYVQRQVGVKDDGIAGVLTWAAIAKRFGAVDETPTTDPIDNGDRVDARSEGNIDTLLPVVRPLARALVREVNAEIAPKVIKVTSAYRTPSEQNELYEQGRTKPGKIVTNARAGYSNHNFALAFDVTLFDEAGKPIYESGLYSRFGQIGRGLGLLWGGDWSSHDEPHFEYRPEWAKDLGESQALAEYRERQSNGVALV